MNALNLLFGVALAQTWTSYSASADHFSVVFPGKVQSQATEQVEAGQKVKTTIYLAKSEQGPACILSSTIIPGTMKDADRAKMNDGIVIGFLKSSQFTKVSEKQATYGKNTGRYIKVKRGAAEGALWIVSNKQQVFTLTAVNPKGDSAATESKFFNSFKITK